MREKLTTYVVSTWGISVPIANWSIRHINYLTVGIINMMEVKFLFVQEISPNKLKSNIVMLPKIVCKLYFNDWSSFVYWKSEGENYLKKPYAYSVSLRPPAANFATSTTAIIAKYSQRSPENPKEIVALYRSFYDVLIKKYYYNSRISTALRQHKRILRGLAVNGKKIYFGPAFSTCFRVFCNCFDSSKLLSCFLLPASNFFEFFWSGLERGQSILTKLFEPATSTKLIG